MRLKKCDPFWCSVRWSLFPGQGLRKRPGCWGPEKPPPPFVAHYLPYSLTDLAHWRHFPRQTPAVQSSVADTRRENPSAYLQRPRALPSGAARLPANRVQVDGKHSCRSQGVGPAHCDRVDFHSRWALYCVPTLCGTNGRGDMGSRRVLGSVDWLSDRPAKGLRGIK
jgi:hypothetical protein